MILVGLCFVGAGICWLVSASLFAFGRWGDHTFDDLFHGRAPALPPPAPDWRLLPWEKAEASERFRSRVAEIGRAELEAQRALPTGHSRALTAAGVPARASAGAGGAGGTASLSITNVQLGGFLRQASDVRLLCDVCGERIDGGKHRRIYADGHGVVGYQLCDPYTPPHFVRHDQFEIQDGLGRTVKMVDGPAEAMGRDFWPDDLPVWLGVIGS